MGHQKNGKVNGDSTDSFFFPPAPPSVPSPSTDSFFNSFINDFGSGSEVEERYFSFPVSVTAVSVFH